MRFTVRLIVTEAVTLISSVLLVVLMIFAHEPAYARNSEDFTLGGETVSAVRIDELSGLNRIQYANYAEGEWVAPTNISDESSLPKGKLVPFMNHAPKPGIGSYQFIVSHLDLTKAGAVEVFKNGLNEYRGFDGNFHVTVYIPPIFSACAIYVDNKLVETAGKMKDYDFTEFNQTGKLSTEHVEGVKGIYVDIPLYGVRSGAVPEGINAGKVVTIHFETSGELAAGVRGEPLVGVDSRVRGYVRANIAGPVVIAVLAGIVLFLTLFLCLLKRAFTYLIQLGVALGVLFTCIARVIIWLGTSAPFGWASVAMFFLAFLAFAAIITLRVKIKGFPVWIPAAGLAALHCIMNVSMTFMPVRVFAALHIYRLVMSIILGLIVLGLVTVTAIRGKENPMVIVIPCITGVVTAVTPFITLQQLTYLTSPVIWLFAAITAVTIINFCRDIIQSERTNKYLTKNLSDEVERRTADLKELLAEREKLLRYISHDLKKPVSGMRRFLGELLDTEEDPKRKRAIEVVLAKANTVNDTLNDLNTYSKLNFSAEQPGKYELGSILRSVAASLSLDCEANDILLHYVPASVFAYCRKNTLISVINNLVFNAIEHAECRNIVLSASKTGEYCKITVTDDGKGIANIDVFEPYVTAGDNVENLGLGLHICRELLLNMGGDLKYGGEDGKTVFTVLLPPA